MTEEKRTKGFEPKEPLDIEPVPAETLQRLDRDTLVRYKVTQEVIPLDPLRQEMRAIEEVLAMPEPTMEELAEIGRIYHPYYQREYLVQRLEEIRRLLETP